MSWVERRIVDRFAELKGLPREQRMAFAQQAHRRALRRHPWRFCLVFLPQVLWLPPFGASLIVLPQSPVAARVGVPPYAIMAAVVVFWIIVAFPVVYWVARSWERFAIRLRIAAPECWWCGFALAGLPRQDAVVTCPECGTVQVAV